jgi:hypothetical protein
MGGIRLDNTPENLEKLTQICVVTLQIYYDGECPDECVEAKARTFAVWHLARNGHRDGQPSGTVQLRRELQSSRPYSAIF